MDFQISTLHTFLEKKMPIYMQTLKKMVDTNSFTTNPAGVNTLGKMTAAWFSEMGFSAETIQSHKSEYGKHLFLTRKGSSGKKIALVSHLDTVFSSEDEAANNFHWREEGDRIYGPGTMDIKGGTVLIFMVLDGLRQVHPDLFHSITWEVMLDAAEEADARDFGALLNERLATDCLACLVFEAGNFDGQTFQILVKRKGMLTYEIATVGKASHAGTSHGQGASAIIQLADVIKQLESLTDYANDLTFNVGSISGGSVNNRIPHAATLKGEMRAYDDTVFAAAKQHLIDLDGSSTVSSPSNGFKATVQVTMDRGMPPWPENAGTNKLYDLWEASAETVGYKTTRQARGGLSDGNYVWQTTPTIDALGPDGGNAHCSEHSDDGSKVQEYVTRSSFIPKALVNITAIIKLIQTNG